MSTQFVTTTKSHRDSSGESRGSWEIVSRKGSGPLAGLRVLDLSRVLAAPWCTQILGDMGADVVKIERPKVGDDSRHFGPPWLTSADGKVTRESCYFISTNRSKRSMTVDVGCTEGREIVRKLASEADILVENFKTGDLARKGLGYADLRAVNPRLIYCSITGFGATGPQAADPGYDYIIQAQGGVMSLTGRPDGSPGAGPIRVGVAVSDLTTGMNAAVAILAALHARERSGTGQWIDMAMLDVQVSWLANQAQAYFATGAAPPRTGDQHVSIVPYQPFATKDVEVIIAVGNDSQFQRLCAALGCSELAADERFIDNAARVANRAPVIATLASKIAQWASKDLLAQLRQEQIPCGPILSVDGVFADPQVLERGMVVEVEHASLGAIRTVANPTKFSATPMRYERPPPTLGEHTEEVLTEILGMSKREIAEMRARGVI